MLQKKDTRVKKIYLREFLELDAQILGASEPILIPSFPGSFVIVGISGGVPPNPIILCSNKKRSIFEDKMKSDGGTPPGLHLITKDPGNERIIFF